jgi:hypothetical protein
MREVRAAYLAWKANWILYGFGWIPRVLMNGYDSRMIGVGKVHIISRGTWRSQKVQHIIPMG